MARASDEMESATLLAGLVALLLVLVTLRIFGSGVAVDQPNEKKSIERKDKTRGRSKPIGALYTAAEVREHNDENDLWLVIDAKVYDFTPYVIQHPGGDAILRNAGKDSTEGFHGPQHGENVKRMIADYYIGELEQ